MERMKRREFERKRIMRKDQSGFTLVEMLIAVTIMAIVIAAVCSFIIVGSKSYASGNSDISVQQEAQLALNQISDVLIDTTRSVNYAAYDASGSATLGLKDAEFAFEPSGKSLTMLNGVSVVNPGGGETIEEGNGNKNYLFYWDKADETLYYSEIGITETTFPLPGESGCVVLAEHVKEFSVDLTQVEEKRVVQIAMTFTNGNKEYKTSNNITIRNKVGINDVTIAPLDRKVELSVIPREISVILEPGETYHFSTPKVTGKNVTDKSVVWSVEGSGVGDPPAGGTTPDGSGFTDVNNGILQIAAKETAASFNVVITTNAKDSDGNHATATVIVNVKRVTNVTLSKSSDEDADNKAEQVSPGKKFTVSSTVSGMQLGVACSGCSDNPTTDFDVTDWTVEGPAALVESNEKQATFLVNSDAKKDDKITIRATSYLSKLRPYDDVQGILELTVAKSKERDIIIEGDIEYGKATPMRVVKPEGHYYIICARFKESQDAPASSDKIVLFGSNGNNGWFTPDFFGLDMQKTWYFSLQAIYPNTNYDQENAEDPIVKEVVEEYLNNCDDGIYVGNKYNKSDINYYVIYPPTICYDYNGKITYGNLTLEPMSVVRSGGEVTRQFKVDHIANVKGDGEKDKYVQFVVYRGESENPSSWGDPIYGYDIENYDGYKGSKEVGGLSFEGLNATNINLRLKKASAMEAEGSYHIVPYIKYANRLEADHGYPLYYHNYVMNFETQCFALPESTIHFKVENGNISLNAYYDNTHFKGVGYFPLPSEAGFTNYFEKKNTSEQVKEWKTINMFCPFRNDVCSVGFKKIICNYVSKEDAYILEFIYQDNQGHEYTAGKFRCNSDGTKWEQISAGNYTGG